MASELGQQVGSQTASLVLGALPGGSRSRCAFATTMRAFRLADFAKMAPISESARASAKAARQTRLPLRLIGGGQHRAEGENRHVETCRISDCEPKFIEVEPCVPWRALAVAAAVAHRLGGRPDGAHAGRSSRRPCAGLQGPAAPNCGCLRLERRLCGR